MHVILGATGHIGTSLAQALLDRGERVTVVTRNEARAQVWRRRGAGAAVLDIRDTRALRTAFGRNHRLFLLNPPADPSTDTEIAERATMHSILSAIVGSKIEKIVAASTYGARPGTKIGDLGVLGEMEQALSVLPVKTTVVRAAYYMTNWDFALATARDEGIVRTFYPPDLVLPMVAPRDIGQLDARLLMDPVGSIGLHHLEGPARYSSNDVATAFSVALGRRVDAVHTPRERWTSTLHELGFSEKAAESYCGMTDAALKTAFPTTSFVLQGTTTLQQHIHELVRRSRQRDAA